MVLHSDTDAKPAGCTASTCTCAIMLSAGV